MAPPTRLPLPKPIDNPNRIPDDAFAKLQETNPERFCRKCGQWTMGHPTITCSLCDLLTHDSCVDKNTKAYLRNKNVFFVCDQCRYDMKDSIVKYSERSKIARDNFAKLQQRISEVERERTEVNERLIKERADRIDAERARDALRDTAINSARTIPTTQARKRPRTEDLQPEQIQTLDIIEQTVESQLAPINQQLRTVLNNIREQNDRVVTSDDRTIQPQTRSQPRRTKQTYAAAITKSSTPTTFIRNINVIVTTPEEDQRVATMIRNDELFAEFDIKAIKQRGKLSFTVIANSEQGAIQLEQRLLAKYQPRIEVIKVDATRPMVKITKLENTQRHTLEIEAQILAQNKWLDDIEFEIDRSYPVNAQPESYLNLIVFSDLRGQKQMLTHGFIIFGGKECKIYEYVNVLQCVKCQRFGHYGRDCTHPAACKLCAGGHETKDCDANDNTSRCVNCITANRNGAKFNIRHRATDERCGARLERIEALKLHFAKN